MMDWNDLRVFLALRRAGTFAGAGRELAVNATTAARRLAALEEAIGAQLFLRTADGLVPTAAAEEIFEPAELVERQAERIQRSVGGEDARLAGSVCLSVTQAFASGFLIDHLGAFRRMHPEIEIELTTSDVIVDLARGGADLAVRFRSVGSGPGDTSGHVDVIGKRVSVIGIGVYGARSYLKNRGVPRDAAQLEGHDIIAPRQVAAYLPGSDWARAAADRNRVTLLTDGMTSMGAACAAGFGLCAIPCFVALREETLIRLPEPAIVDSRDAWLLMPADLRRVARVRAVWEFLLELFATWSPLLSGEVFPAQRIAKGPDGAIVEAS